MISALVSLTGKNLKLFFRSKLSSVAVILIPLIVVMLAGFLFNSSGLSNVQVGVYSDSYSEFANGIIGDLEGSGFSSVPYDSEEACVNSIKYSDSQVCVVFPADLDSDISEEDIVFYVDYSRANLAYNLVGEIEEDILLRTSGVGEGIAQGLIDSLEGIKASLPAIKEGVDNAIVDAEGVKDISGDLEFPESEISSVIESLESVKPDINDSGVRAEVEDILVVLREIETEGESLGDKFKDVRSEQSKTIAKLEEVQDSLEEVLVALNSGRVVGAGDIVSPINTRVEAVSVDSNNRDFIVPTVLSLIGLFGSILLAATIVLRNKKTKAFFRNFMAPVNNFVFVLSVYLACLIIVLVQFVFVFVGIEYILKIDTIPAFAPLALVLFVSLSVFITIGMFIGYLFRSEESVVFSSMIIAALLMFFSNIILPLENITGKAFQVLNYNPLVLSDLALKKIMLFGFGLDSIYLELGVLVGFFVFFFLLSCVFRLITRRML